MAACQIKSVNVIIVDDGSATGIKPGSEEIIRKGIAPANLRLNKTDINRGKGHALREAAKNAMAEIQIFTDIDFPYSTDSFAAIVHSLKAGADIAAGVREETYYENVPSARKTISRLFRKVLKAALKLEITDTQAGLKGFNAKGKELFLQTTIDRFLFDLKFIFLASNTSEINLVPVKVTLRPDVVFSKMNWKILIAESGNFMKIFFRNLRKKPPEKQN